MATKRSKPGVSPSLEPNQALPILVRQREKGRELQSRPLVVLGDYDSWNLTTGEQLLRAFGSESQSVGRFEAIGRPYSGSAVGVIGQPRPVPPPPTQEQTSNRLKLNIENKLTVLDSCLDQLEALVPGSPVVPSNSPRPSPNARLFVVHGRNEGIRESVARFLESLGLPVTILHEQPNKGRTIIEKFEDYADDVGFAVVLLTGDDRGGLAETPPKGFLPRARQNVILELGFFLGKIDRERVCPLRTGR